MRITLPSGTPAELARPSSGAEPTRGVVLIPDIGGLRPLFYDLVQRLADENTWAVCTFDLWPGREELALADKLASGGTLGDVQVLGDAASAADATGCAEVAVTGFCIGGMFTLKAAGTGRFVRAAAFYGMGRVPDDWRSDTMGEPLDFLARPERCPDAGDRRHGRLVGAGRRPAGPAGGRRRGRALRGRRPRLRPRPVAADPPARRRRRRLGAGHRAPLGLAPPGSAERRPAPPAPPEPAAQRERRSSCSRSVMR